MTLVSEQAYTTYTGDNSTVSGLVTAALSAAQGLAESRLGRALGRATYTEILRVWPVATPYSGNTWGEYVYYVYPHQTPLDPNQVGYVDEATLAVTPDWGLTGARLEMAVTYVAGWSDGQAPVDVQIALSRMANAILRVWSDDAAANGQGIKSESMGDLSVTYVDPTPLEQVGWVPSAWPLLRRYRCQSTISA